MLNNARNANVVTQRRAIYLELDCDLQSISASMEGSLPENTAGRQPPKNFRQKLYGILQKLFYGNFSAV